MSRITRFLCYFLSLKLASVLSFYAFPSLVAGTLFVKEFSEEKSMLQEYDGYFRKLQHHLGMDMSLADLLIKPVQALTRKE